MFICCCLLVCSFCSGQLRNDVIIDEIMADPSPPAGLPEIEFIELKNNSAFPVDLFGWKIGDATGISSINIHVILQPDSFVIITGNASVIVLSSYGRTIGVNNFISLDNDGELIFLQSRNGKTIHAVDYKKQWYQNAVKSLGGWSLEMIDAKNPCGGINNWKASENARGGSPGRRNSIDASNRDIAAPQPLRAYTTDSTTVMILFNESLDSASVINKANFQISDDIGSPASVSVIAPLFNKVRLTLNSALQRNKAYVVTIKNLIDCGGNMIGKMNTIRVGVSSSPGTSDIVINEVLFNPRPGGVDYVEIYNRTNKVIDIKDLFIANRNGVGQVASLWPLSTESHLLFSGDYLVITENAFIIKQQYSTRTPDVFKELSSLPSYPDEKGTVILLNVRGLVIDELPYDEKLHFKLIENKEGVALERIDYNALTKDPGNWHSAATNAGYGTPGFQNSQFKAIEVPDGIISVTPSTFSPDNDGFNDAATIYYNFDEPGYVCNITLYRANGTPVRLLTRNALCGLKGSFRWDGLDDRNNKLGIGVYIMFAEVFNLKGKVKRFRHAIVLAGKL